MHDNNRRARNVNLLEQTTLGLFCIYMLLSNFPALNLITMTPTDSRTVLSCLVHITFAHPGFAPAGLNRSNITIVLY
jgi:hypothetical protein